MDIVVGASGTGGAKGVTGNPSAANYGNGGVASSAEAAGKGGIVIIRFKR